MGWRAVDRSIMKLRYKKEIFNQWKLKILQLYNFTNSTKFFVNDC